MNENKRIEILGKLISEKHIPTELKARRQDYFYETISIKDDLERKEIKEAYEKKGWEFEKDFKKSIKMRILKTHDIEFEDRVWSLFALMGYKFLNRDRKFDLPYDKNNENLTKQIDVFAKDDETILLIECKSAATNKRGDFKKELESYKGIIDGLRKSIQSLFPNKKHKIRFILATNNLSISDEDLDRLKSINGVLLNEESIKYFFDLHHQLGKASKYQFLGNIFEGQEIPEMENKIPAVRGKMGGHTYYSFSTEPENLLKIGYVLHRNKANINMMPTYQRLIKKSRLKAVGEFIGSGGYFPNAIVISIDAKNCTFEQANTQVQSTISDIGILHLPKKYKSAYIIDGQHRLYGYSNSEYKFTNTIPVVAFVNLSRDEQIQLFMQINENQKSVPKSLRETLNADLKWTSEILSEQFDALSSRIAINLGENRNSVLFDKIYIGEDVRILTQNNIKLALKKGTYFGKINKNKIEELGYVYAGDIDFAFEKLKNLLLLYFQYLYDNLPLEWENETESLVLSNNGIYGLILSLSDILKHIDDNNILSVRKSNPKNIFSECQPFINPIISFIKNLSVDSRIQLRKSYGAGGQTKHWRTFQKIIRDTHKQFNPEGLDDYLKKQELENNDAAISIIRNIETLFKKDFRERLLDHFGKKWFEKGVPPKIGDKATVDALTKNRNREDHEGEVEAWDCLNIIAYREIASNNWEIFEKEYTKPGEEKINGGRVEKTKWMVKLEYLRNQNFHSYYVTHDELSFLEELNDWLIKKELRNKFQKENG